MNTTSTKPRKFAAFKVIVNSSRFNERLQFVAGPIDKEDDKKITIINLFRQSEEEPTPYRTYLKSNIVGAITRRNF